MNGSCQNAYLTNTTERQNGVTSNFILEKLGLKNSHLEVFQTRLKTKKFSKK